MSTSSPHDTRQHGALARQQLTQLQHAIAQLGWEELSSHGFSSAARGHAELLAALPPAFGGTLLNLLDRLESSASFTDSGCCCSFNYQGLVDNLRQWAAKAEAALARQSRP